jgi:hypothetical protein
MWQFVTHSLLLENLHYWACSNCSHWSSSCYLNVEQVFYVLMGVVISHVPNDIFLFPFFFTNNYYMFIWCDKWLIPCFFSYQLCSWFIWTIFFRVQGYLLKIRKSISFSNTLSQLFFDNLLCIFLLYRDTAGQEHFWNITSSYYFGASSIILGGV